MGADRLKAAFGGRGGVPAFVAFVTGGFPTRADTVPAMLAMQECGVSVIEVRCDPRDGLRRDEGERARSAVLRWCGHDMCGCRASPPSLRAARQLASLGPIMHGQLPIVGAHRPTAPRLTLLLHADRRAL